MVDIWEFEKLRAENERLRKELLKQSDLTTRMMTRVSDLEMDLANAEACHSLAMKRVAEEWKKYNKDIADANSRAEAVEARERLKDKLLKESRPFCHGCYYVKDGRLADKYTKMKRENDE